MKFSSGKIMLTLIAVIYAGLFVHLGIEYVKENKKYNQGREEARELLNQTKGLEGRIVFVDEERIPKEIGGGLAGRRIIFIEKEYLRIRSNGEEYDFMIGGTTPLHEGDSIKTNYFSQETLERLKSNGHAYAFLNETTFSEEVVNLALTSQIDGLVTDYRRIK
jgi:hypothetical protein